MEPVINIQHLTKQYGSSRGVHDISLQVPKGVVFGFLGPNGAGKTTTISMLVDLLRPTSGRISLFGLDSHRDSLAIRRKVGFLAGDMALDTSLTGMQQLHYFAHIHGTYDLHYINELAQRLNCDVHRKIKALSRGNKQKIGLIAALMHKPELLILDEPTSGLDPLVQAEFNKIVIEHKQAGNTAFISSHILSEVQEICDQVAFIREGRLVATKSMQQIAAELPRHITITSSDSKLFKALESLDGVTGATRVNEVITCSFSGNMQALLRVLAKHVVQDIVIERADLDALFMRYYKG